MALRAHHGYRVFEEAGYDQAIVVPTADRRRWAAIPEVPELRQEREGRDKRRRGWRC